ncbi:hypothetical protein [uncultured Shimia sp.]|uniref:hypothetical protein n=1 Tax=uncultured Shimia sp. TaxID=573152 RepID=UPI00261F184E|nr:hypothetical protein [uncultured Shimia sp.]
MSDEKESRPTPLGIYDKPSRQMVTGVEVIAIVLSGIWLAGTAIFFLILGGAPGEGDSLQFVMTMLAVFMPVAMIWVAATAARSSRIMREESARLQAAIDAMRRTYVSQTQGVPIATGAEPSVTRKLDEIAAAQRKTETALATFSSSRDHNPGIRKTPEPEVAQVDAEDQGLLALGTPVEDLSPPLDREVFISALNFPENAEDKVGFAALRKALKDRQASQLIQAAQDVLTLLSQDGIYMDDLRPDLARPEIWRRFAAGERGRQIAQLGGIRDRTSLALAAGRMKQDTIFRDAAHHFLRRFDRTFVEFEETASDAQIAALSDTRTARAFMLLGRVAGIFD